MTREKDAKEILKIVEKWKDGYPTTMYNKIHEYYYKKSQKTKTISGRAILYATWSIWISCWNDDIFCLEITMNKQQNYTGVKQ